MEEEEEQQQEPATAGMALVWVGVRGGVLITAAVIHGGLRDLVEMRGTKSSIPPPTPPIQSTLI